MAFKPLGYRFEVNSMLSVAAAKAAIRKHKDGWLAAEGEPRGWIVGPFLCLWSSSFRQFGPMVIAMFRSAGLNSRIVGRAGSDLNGIALSIIVVPLFLWLLVSPTASEDFSQGELIYFALILVLTPLVLWSAHRDRSEADPLVDFIRQTVGESQ